MSHLGELQYQATKGLSDKSAGFRDIEDISESHLNENMKFHSEIIFKKSIWSSFL